MNTEFFNDPVGLLCSFDARGEVNLQSIIWQERTYMIVAAGRQWTDEVGRYVLAESTDGTRFEIELARADLLWRVKKVWRSDWVA
jgi:hypothetical protein